MIQGFPDHVLDNNGYVPIKRYCALHKTSKTIYTRNSTTKLKC